MKKIEFTVTSEKPMTLQCFLLGQKGVSKRLLTRLKRMPMGITRNGKLIRSIDTVSKGDVIVLQWEDTSLLEPNGNLCVPIAFENENLVVFNKPCGMPVHPSIKHQGDTLGNYFAFLYPDLCFRPVNRLDRDTSGLCLVAKNAHSANRLQGNAHKTYYAVVEGDTPEYGTIDAPIARERESIILRCVREDGQSAVTHYKKLKYANGFSIEEIRLETGRTHQIRVHFSHIGFPLAGDDMYGGGTQFIARQALHCGKLTFAEPVTNEEITVTAELPQDMLSLIE